MAVVLPAFSNRLHKIGTAPRGPRTIDWSNPLAHGLEWAFCGGGGDAIDLVANKSAVRSGSTFTDAGTSQGTGFSQTATGKGMVSPSISGTRMLTGSRVSIFVRLYWAQGANTGTGILYIPFNNAGGSPFVVWGIIAAGATAVRAAWNRNGTFVNGTTSSALGSGTINSLSATFDVVASEVRLYLNGILDKTDTSAFSTGAPTSSSTSLVSLGDVTASARAIQGVLTCGYIWSRKLHVDEITALHNAPYQFIIPAEREMPVVFLPPEPPAPSARKAMPYFFG